MAEGRDVREDEKWRPVLDFEGIYEVSSHGRVRSLDRLSVRNGEPFPVRGRILATNLDGKGRPSVSLHRDGLIVRRRVHRLVLEAFVGPRPAGMEACHNDDDRTNNLLSNLRWDTKSGNMRDAVRHRRNANTKKTHCIAGHPFTGDNVQLYTYKGMTKRHCVTCRTAQNERRCEARRQAKAEARRLAGAQDRSQP